MAEKILQVKNLKTIFSYRGRSGKNGKEVSFDVEKWKDSRYCRRVRMWKKYHFIIYYGSSTIEW